MFYFLNLALITILLLRMDDSLNAEQIKAAEFDGKHLLVLAGAGTGKTKTVIARAKFLIDKGVSPNRIAILSFTRKSAKEIAERLKASVPSAVRSGISGKTFHSWCTEIMKNNPVYFPQSTFTCLDEDDRESAMGVACGKYLRDKNDVKITAKMVIEVYSYAINTLCGLSEAIRHTRYYNMRGSLIDESIIEDRDKYDPVIRKYIEYKKERRYIDYDDILNIVAVALESNEQLRNIVTSKYDHILVDEMQDTNPLQYKLLKSFIDKCHLFCVGDDAQSIYSFRGADFRIIHSFTEIIPNSEVYKLTLNYRSTQKILDISNWLLRKSPLKYDKELIAHKGDGLMPKLVHTKNEWEEARIITEDIFKRVFQENGKYKDTIVLGRSSYSLSKVEGLCLEKKIPYVKIGGTKLMQSAHVRDVVSAMRIVSNFLDELAWMRFLKMWDRIGDVTASKIFDEIADSENIDEVIFRLMESKNKYIVNSIPDTLTNIYDLVNNPSLAIKRSLDSMSAMLKKRYDNWDYRKRDFEVLQEVAKSTSSISEFITEYILDPQFDTTEKHGSSVQEDVVLLSTIHSAKGLEAPICHIVNVAPHSYPSVRAIGAGTDEVEEERRCLYVAMTRAKERLSIYRNTYSIHTQPEHVFTTNQLRVGMRFKDISDEKEVVIESIKKAKKEKFIQFEQNGKIQTLLDVNFLASYKPILDEDDAKELYFLNDLPLDLVEVVVPEDEDEENYNINVNVGDIDFPDFNFE